MHCLDNKPQKWLRLNFDHFLVHHQSFRCTEFKSKRRKKNKRREKKKVEAGGESCEMINLEEPSLSYNFFILKASEWQR